MKQMQLSRKLRFTAEGSFHFSSISQALSWKPLFMGICSKNGLTPTGLAPQFCYCAHAGTHISAEMSTGQLFWERPQTGLSSALLTPQNKPQSTQRRRRVVHSKPLIRPAQRQPSQAKQVGHRSTLYTIMLYINTMIINNHPLTVMLSG